MCGWFDFPLCLWKNAGGGVLGMQATLAKKEGKVV